MQFLPTTCGALLLAALLPCAQAQSTVTVSGTIDIGVYKDAGKHWNVGPISRSHLKFSGSEDLGSGLSATFALSHRFNSDDGSTESASKPFWHGEATVGLKGAFGSLQLGRRLDVISNNDWAFDPWYNFDRLASPAWDLWHYNFPSDPKGNGGSAEYGRLNNGIFYDSPSVNGLTLHLSGSPEERTGDTDKALSAGVQYKGAGFGAFVAHGKNSAGHTDTFIGLNTRVAGIGLMGAYDVSKAGASKAKATTLGASYGIGATTLQAGWGQVDVDGSKAEKMVSVGASHALSKRTSVYGDLAHKTYPGDSATVYGVGINHSF
ncbi:MAG: hypothetical protein RL223_2298 [Pseudomonadota bacterium]|jgi:predicted porin